MVDALQKPKQIKIFSQSVAQGMQLADAANTVSWYLSSLEKICQSSGQRLSYQQINAVFNGAAKVWMSAQHENSSWSQQQQLDQDLHGFLRTMLHRLHLGLPQMDCRGASNILWAFSRMQVNPDELLPGTVNGLAHRFVKDIDSANGHSYASFMLACARLKLNPLQGQMFPILMDHLRRRDLSDLNSQAAANIIYSLAKASVVPPAMHLLHKLHNRFLVLFDSTSPDTLPSAQEVANFAWAMSELKYHPSREIAAAMKARMLELCQHSEDQPKATEISSFLHACAQLRVSITQQEADILVDSFCAHSLLQAQGVANIAWALAVSRLLKLDRFRQLLSYLPDMKEEASINAHLNQMYQAWDRLGIDIGTGLEQNAASAEVQAQLEQLGIRPYSGKPLRNGGLYAALAELGLQFEPDCEIYSYRVNAVVTPCISSTARPIIILVGEPDCFINEPSR